MEATPLIRTAEQQRVELRFGAPIGDILRRLYDHEGLDQPEVAERLGVSKRSVIRWMKACGIPTRDRRAVTSEAEAA